MIYTVTLNPSLDRALYFDNLELGEVNRAVKVVLNPGGKGINVSRALAKYGVRTTLLGYIAGAAGRWIWDSLTADGLDCDFIFVEGETRSNITIFDLANQQTTKLNEPGTTVLPGHLAAFQAKLQQLLIPGDLLILSGSLPPGAPLDTYAQLIRIAKSCHAVTALDTSGKALKLGCAAGPDWLKPNWEEASYLTGLDLLPDTWQPVISQIQANGVQYVLLTGGESGVIYAADGQTWHAQPPRITVASTVGAGDAALAGAVNAWLSGCTQEEVAHRAAAAGTAAAMLEGSEMPNQEQIQPVYLETKTRLIKYTEHEKE